MKRTTHQSRSPLAQSRRKSNHTQRGTLGVLSVVGCLGIAACTAAGHASAEGDIKVPFSPPVSWKASATIGEFEIDGGTANASKCLKVTWIDATGAEISSDTMETDGSGTASGQVPAGSVRWEGKLVDCPKPDPEPEDDNRMFNPFSGQLNFTAGLSNSREFLIYGAPITPSDDAGANNLTYSFVVTASSYAEAEALIAPIIAGGVGTPVPSTVEVISFTTMESNLAGGRVTTSMPGKFENYRFNFNSGAFSADLVSGFNTINYQIGTWDVVEMVIPLSAFDYGFLPGVTYSNEGSSKYTTDRLEGPVGAGYSFNYSN
jgi:hypothetical protein